MAEIVKLSHEATGPVPSIGLPLPKQPPAHDGLAQLLATIAGGDERAFARLYELTAARLLMVARTIVGRPDLAEDVLQETFLRVWRAAHQYDPHEGSALAWLVTIVRNRALTLKSRMHRHDDRLDAVDVETIVSEGPDPASQLMLSEEARRVKACLVNLPVNHRRSIAMVYFEGLTHQELAERLDVRLGTAKSWVRRGLAQMGQCLIGRPAADWRERVAADYAIGSLQGTARRAFERARERDARFCQAADVWESKLALLTEFLPDPGAPPRQVWSRIEQEIALSRVSFSRPRLWPLAVAGLIVLAALLIAAL
jgi:RNA polymerase sigma-70 factor, ECF subfamily